MLSEPNTHFFRWYNDSTQKKIFNILFCHNKFKLKQIISLEHILVLDSKYDIFGKYKVIGMLVGKFRFRKKNGYLYLLFIKFINLLFFCNLFKLIFIEDGDGDWEKNNN